MSSVRRTFIPDIFLHQCCQHSFHNFSAMRPKSTPHHQHTNPTPATTASNFCPFSTPNFSFQKIAIFFAHVLVVASNPCEAVLHSRPLHWTHHHHHLLCTFTHTHTATRGRSNKSQNDTNKTHLSYNKSF